MKLRIDLHVHTVYSKDSLIEIEGLVPRCRAAGLDGVAVTDHETLEGAWRAAERCGDLLVIPGMEVETQEGHILALDVERPVERRLGFRDTIERIDELGGTAVVAHPFSLLKPLLDVDVLAASKPDAIEVANAASFPYSWMLRINKALAERFNLPMTGGSDAHIPETIGRSYTVVDSDSRSISDILEAIREGRTEVRGRGITLQERLMKILKRRKGR
ncbi:MAG: CehA/McbA family metallohydrolase [Candidatus Bathyarchaeia archaeon]